MSVIFESTIKSDENGKAYILLKDTVDNREVTCQDVEDYSKKIEELGNDYGGRIDEVKWFVDENVSDQELDKIKIDMNKYKESMDKK